MRSQRFAVCILISAGLIALAGAARAATYQVSTKNRFFCCTSPPIVIGAPNGGYHTVGATASVTGSGTPAIKIGMGRVAHVYLMQTKHFPNASIKTSRVTFSVSNAAGTLQKGGGNAGPFSFCPKAKGPGPGACTNASKASPGFKGRIKVTPGKNHFGGTLQILAGPGGIGGNQGFVYRYIGGLNMSMLPAVSSHGLRVFSPIGAMTPGKERVHTLPSVYDSVANSIYLAGGRFWENGAGLFTTGMVTLNVNKQSVLPPFSVMLTGYDNRTPMGVGNIQLVSGLLVNRFATSIGGNRPAFPYGWKMRIQVIPEPEPSLALATGMLGLLLVGWLRARLGRSGRLQPD